MTHVSWLSVPYSHRHRREIDRASTLATRAGAAVSDRLAFLFPRSASILVDQRRAPDWRSLRQDSADLWARTAAWARDNPVQAAALSAGALGVVAFAARAVRERRIKLGERSRLRAREREAARRRSEASAVASNVSNEEIASDQVRIVLKLGLNR